MVESDESIESLTDKYIDRPTNRNGGGNSTTTSRQYSQLSKN